MVEIWKEYWFKAFKIKCFHKCSGRKNYVGSCLNVWHLESNVMLACYDDASSWLANIVLANWTVAKVSSVVKTANGN